MTKYELKNIDPEGIEDLLIKIEKSFDIRFIADELFYITNSEQLYNHIINKIQLDSVDDCTSQQAFYKLRNAISSTFQIDSKIISTNFSLINLLPQHSRKSRIKKLETHLGFELNLLQPSLFVLIMFLILFFISFVVQFFNSQLGLFILAFSIIGILFAARISNEIELITIKQIVEKMTIENYVKSRRNHKTFNKKEVEKILTRFIEELEECYT